MMNFRSPLFVLLVSALPFMFANGQVTEGELCGPNQHFEECGITCPPHCMNCSEEPCLEGGCSRGCYCNNEYIFENEKSKNCIPESSCVSCPENSHYDCCGNCYDTCDHGIMCLRIKGCVARCVCNAGYVDHSGKCILKSKCPGR